MILYINIFNVFLNILKFYLETKILLCWFALGFYTYEN